MTTVQIGILGHPVLVQQNIRHLRYVQEQTPEYQQLQMAVVPLYRNLQIAGLDGLLITGWQEYTLSRRLLPFKQTILAQKDSLALWGIAAGASMLGRDNMIPMIDCDISCRSGHNFSTSILEFPGNLPERCVGIFLPEVTFSSSAPNLTILCQNHTRGIIAIRQGNHLASSFAAELTSCYYLYQYWMEMVLRLKEWQI